MTTRVAVLDGSHWHLDLYLPTLLATRRSQPGGQAKMARYGHGGRGR
jgi:hypothetical protein